MRVVEDVRQVLQDFLAPELRAISARLDSLEVKMDSKFEVVDSKLTSLNSRIDHAEQSAKIRHDALLDQFDSVKRLLDLDYRLKKLERQQSEPAA